MEPIELYKRLASESPNEWLQIKVPPVLKEILRQLAGNDGMSEFVRNLIIAEWERQTAVKDKES